MGPSADRAPHHPYRTRALRPLPAPLTTRPVRICDFYTRPYLPVVWGQISEGLVFTSPSAIFQTCALGFLDRLSSV